MTQLHYTAEVKAGRLLELPAEAEELHLKPGDKVQVQLDLPTAPTQASEEELREFKRNMNKPRKEAGARLLYPEVE